MSVLRSSNNIKWIKSWREWCICGGTMLTTHGIKEWKGSFFLIGLPWFQIKFEKNWVEVNND